jgi:predicted RNA-binding protein (virulence factor B family)
LDKEERFIYTYGKFKKRIGNLTKKMEIEEGSIYT